MSKYCPQCGTRRDVDANYCGNCGHRFEEFQPIVESETSQLTTFQGMGHLAAEVDQQLTLLRRNTWLEPLQRVLDNIAIRSNMEEATHQQKAQILEGYQAFIREQVEQTIDTVRNARRLAEGNVYLEIEQRRFDMVGDLAERTHQLRLEEIREQHQHEKGMLELQAQLELLNNVVGMLNRLVMPQLEAEASTKAELVTLRTLPEVLRQSFTALAAIDASQIEYAELIKKLEFTKLEDAESFSMIEDLLEAVITRIAKGVTEFGQSQATDRRTENSA